MICPSKSGTFNTPGLRPLTQSPANYAKQRFWENQGEGFTETQTSQTNCREV